MDKEIFICCGDPSGDLHASKLAAALQSSDVAVPALAGAMLKKPEPKIRISAAGGANLKNVCDNFLFDLVGMNLHGYWEPIRQYPKIRKIFNEIIVKYLQEKRPDGVIAVDFYGFNIRLCERACSMGIPVYYYISPQVWATRPGRINRLKKCVNKMFVIFPFEEKIYREAGVNAVFNGHPMLDVFPPATQVRPAAENPVIGLFPGSRRQVIGWNLPVMLETARIIGNRLPASKFLIAGFEDFKDCYSNSLNVEIIFDRSYAWREKLDLAISVSGTVTLENALLGIPMVVCYKLPQLMYYLVKSMTDLKFVTMVNLINGTEVIGEFIQSAAVPEKIAEAALKILTDPEARNGILKEYAVMRALLGQPGSYERTAKMIKDEISNARNN